ncbi:unnamed protein product [Camellia sinensis]
MAKSQNCKFKCFFGILCCLLCIGSLLTKTSVPTTDIPTTTTTTFENPKKNFKTQVKTPGIVARLMGLDSLPDPRKVFRRKEDQKEKSGVSVFYVYISKLSFYVYIAKCTFVTVHVDGRPPNVIARLVGLDGLPSQQSLHRQHKGFSKTYRQWTASVSMQTDGKPYELRSNGKDLVAQQECKDEYEVLETSKVERSSYPAKRTINSKLSEAEMAFIQQKFMADHGCYKFIPTDISYRILSEKGEGTFGQVLECLDNENLEHLGMTERLLGPLPQHMNIIACLRAEKYFKSARLDWLEGASSKESTRAVWKLPRLQVGCAWEPSVAAQIFGPSLERGVCRSSESSVPPVLDLRVVVSGSSELFVARARRQHKGFSKTYRPWTALVSTQRDGKPYELRSNRKDSMAQQECKDEILSKMGAGTFGQVLECLDNGNLEHLAMTERLLGPLPQHMIISANFRAEKYFKRSARLDWLESASSKESTWSQNSKFKCFSGILRCLLCISSLPTQPYDPTIDILATTTTFENPKKNFKTQVQIPGVVARYMGLDSLPDPRMVFRRKEDQKEKSRVERRTFGQVLECLDNENLEHLAMMERLLGPLPRHMIISAYLPAEKYFKRSARLDWLEGASSKESTRAIWKLPRLQSQNSTFKCFSGILFCLLHIGSLPTQPSNPTTDIATTTTTTFENPKKNFKTKVKTPGVVARLMGLDSLPDPRKVFRRNEDQKEKSGVSMFRLMGLDGLPPQPPLHRQHKGFSETYRQWTASISSQRDGKSYEHRSNRKDSMAQEECMDEYDVLETSKVERTFGQVWQCLDNENLEHLAMMERLLGPLPQHMIISADLRAEKYFKRSARLDWLEGASSKESTRAVWKLPRLQSQNCKFKCFSSILYCLLCIGSLLTQPSVPTTDIPTTTTTTFENPKKNFKTQVKTPVVVTRLMGLESLPDPRKVFRRKEDQKEKSVHIDGRPPNVIARLIGLDGLPSQQPLHRQLKGFSKTYRQWTASVSSQRDGKPYELRSNRKDSMVQQECKDEYEVLETSKVERSSYPAKRTVNSKLSEAEMAFIQQKFMADHGTFGQVLECLDKENLEHLAIMERLLGPLPQHMIIREE